MTRRGCTGLLLASVLLAGVVVPAGAQEPESIVYSAYRYGGRRAGAAIFAVVPGDEPVRLTGSRSFNLEPVWSPDRTRIAYVHHDRPRNPDVWVMDADGTGKARLTEGPRDDTFPQWSPDGSRILWVKTRPSSALGRIYVMDADGTDKTLLRGEETAALARWSPDGTRIAFVTKRRCNDCVADSEIHVMDADGSNETALTDNAVDDSWPVWSPDGTRIAFSRTRSDGGDLFTIAPDGSAEEQLTSLEDFAFLPRWSPDGSEVAFSLLVDAENFHVRLGVVDAATHEERLLTDVATGGLLPDWSADGSRLAFLGFHSGGYNVGVIGRDGTLPVRVTDSDLDEAWLDW